MPEGLLRTKLFPPLPRPNQVMRKLLLEKFIQSRRRGMTCTLVSAPAGFGKTTFVAECVRASGQPFAWLALDEGDNDQLQFWRYVDGALSTLDDRIGEGLRPALYTNQIPSIQEIITGLVNDVTSLDMELTLVLDDYHAIELPTIHDNVNFLLDHLPAKMCLVIITRADPPLNLARRRGRGQLLEIRAADLRFTSGETTAFLNQSMQLGLTDSDITSLEQRTEGWIAGLQMAALSLQDEIDPHRFVAAFNGDDRHIADYLVEEVLQRQLVDIQHFLLQTSILNGLNASLCDAVTGRQDSRAMLNTLERANLFILPLDNRREWFRYHHLFAELLRQRLRETHTGEMLANLHCSAADWYESQGDIAAAISHARSASDDRAILHILERSVGKFFSTGELPQLFELARLLPVEVRKESPFLCASVVWAGMAGNRYTEIPPWLESLEAHFDFHAEELFNDPALEPTRRAALLEFMILRLQAPFIHFPGDKRAHLQAIRDQLNALPTEQICLLNTVINLKPVIAFNLGLYGESTGDLDLAAQSFAEAIPLCRQTQNSSLFHLASAHLANIQISQGRLRAANQTLSRALDEHAVTGQAASPFIALTHASLGALHFEWNNFETARQHFSEGFVHARLWNLWEALFSLTLGQALLKQFVGDTQSAIEILDGLDSPPLAGQELPIRAYASLLRGSDATSAWLAAHPAESTLEPVPDNEFLLLTIARLLASVNCRDEAIALLQKLILFARTGGRNHTLIQANTALAVIVNLPEALLEAIHLAEQEGYITTFVMEGKPLANMLQYLLRQPSLEPRLAVYVRKILSAFKARGLKPKQAGGSAEPLSERELEVLDHIANGLSNPEIARRLYLSPNTLKAHTQNIFLKLEVHNRYQAVKKAKELGLIK